MVVTVDLYKELELDRSWDEKTIKDRLKAIQKLWTQRQGACNDKEQLLIIDKILSAVENAYRYLTKAVKRKQYDAALEKAYKEGKIKDDIEEKLAGLVEQARAYYQKGNIKLAAQCASEAIKGKVNNPDAYEILARCFYDMQKYDNAMKIINSGILAFKDNLHLHWLGARMSSTGTKNYDDAQKRINIILKMAPNNSLGYSEQVYLHLQKGQEELAFQEIDTYISKRPNDSSFKQSVAYNLVNYSNHCYYYDKADNTSFIADKDAYEECLRLCSKAAEIYEDEHTLNRLEHAKFFGQKEWNDWNMDSIRALSLYGALLVLLYWPLGLICLGIDGVLIYFSYRPYWQINKTYVTGEMGALETQINQFGSVMARFSIKAVRFLVKLWGWILKFVLWICNGASCIIQI